MKRISNNTGNSLFVYRLLNPIVCVQKHILVLRTSLHTPTGFEVARNTEGLRHTVQYSKELVLL